MLRNFSKLITAFARRHVSAWVEADNKFIVLHDDNCKSMKFPGIWLRDNCQCSKCFHQPTQSVIDWQSFDVNVKVKSVEIVQDLHGNAVRVEWNDEHRCDFDLEWLKERDFSTDHRQQALHETYRSSPQTWGANEFSSKFNKFDFYEILRNDNDLYKWLYALAVYGVAVIRNAPDDEGVSRKLADRIGFIKRTTYGKEFYVKSKPGAKNYAYLMTPLALHTDMPSYEYMPGINILHYLIQSNSIGGANTICDGFYVAQRLKSEYPDYYNILSTTLVDWYDIGAEGGFTFYNRYRAPVLGLDLEGHCIRINQNTPRRDSVFRIDVEQVIPWYEAYGKFTELANYEAVEFKAQQCDVLTFNNMRMLHGRTAYMDTEENIRCLVGAYVDWDIIYSKLRMMRRRSN